MNGSAAATPQAHASVPEEVRHGCSNHAAGRKGRTDAEVWQNGQGRKKGYCCMPEGKDAGYLHMRPQARY